MKTTLELPDELLERTRSVARREGTTLRALVEEGLQLALRARAQRQRRQKHFSVQPFHGDGLTAEFAGASWQQIRDEIHGVSLVRESRPAAATGGIK
jgi:hypothetical protein